MKTSEQINEIAKALALFQSEVKQPEKDGVNPHFKSRYVTLDSTVKAIHECAPKHGLSFIQMPVSDETGVGVTTVIFHASGQFIEFNPFILPLDKKTPQGAGSALTYAKRYALSSAFGLVSDEDDDGNIAEDHASQKQGNQQKAPLASDKQLNLVKKLLKDVSVNNNLSDAAAYKILKDQIKKDMEWYTVEDASKAIGLLNKSLEKQGA